MDHEGRIARDQEFARWYQTHHVRIRALCARILRDPIAAEDMAQETLLRAWERRDAMREEDLGAWLSVVARNLCLSMLRKDGRLIVTDDLPEHADVWADPAIEVGRRETRRHVRKALGLLGERSRRVIDLREVREADYEVIGSELGVSAEGARAIAFRARRVLKEHLAAVGEGFSGILVGVRIRLRALRGRSRDLAGSIEGFAGTSMQAALNAALGLGVAIVTLAGPVTTLTSRAGPDQAAVIASSTQQPGAQDSPVAGGPSDRSVDVTQVPAKQGRVGVGTITKPKLSGSPYHPSDGSSDFVIRYGPAYVSFERNRGPTSDGLEPAFSGLNTALSAWCEIEPSTCAGLEYGF